MTLMTTPGSEKLPEKNLSLESECRKFQKGRRLLADIFHYFPIKASARKVFQAVSMPTGLDAWWTKRSSGRPEEGAEYELWFGPEYDWRAVVSRCVPDTEFELRVRTAQEDWRETRVGFLLEEKDGVTQVQFHHSAWPEWASERPNLGNGLIVAGNCRGEVVAFRASDGAPQWTFNVKGCIRSIGSSGNILFVGVQEGTVSAFDLSAKP